MMYFQYVSQNGTGTGQIAIKIDTVDKIPVGRWNAICRGGTGRDLLVACAPLHS